MDYLWTPWRMPYLKRDTSGEETCVFCDKATSGDDATYHVLHRGTHCFVTLNLYPYNNGHLMVVPYRHVSTLDDLDDEALQEMMVITRKAIQVLQAAYRPQGFNIGINLGRAAGAGIAGHVHQHIVPRWSGDTNYLTVVGETRTIPEWIDETYTRLREEWANSSPSTHSTR